MEKTFKNKAEEIRKLANDYKKSKIIELKGVDLLKEDKISETVIDYVNTKRQYRYYYSLQMKIDYILERLEWEYSNLLKRDFFNNVNHRLWWESYYSRSTYYRKKNAAMNMFLGLLHA